MALLNLILGSLFVALNLFEGSGGGDGAGGDAPDKGGGGDPGTGTGGDGGEPPDKGGDGDDPEVARWKAHARTHEGLWKSLGIKREDIPAVKEKLGRLAELEDSQKSEATKATERATSAEKERDEARGELLRLQVAIDKGLTPAQASRLRGASKEELEADADELLEAFGGKKPDPSKQPLRRPNSTPRSGNVPDAEPEENDPTKLAAMVPRN